MNNKYKFGIYDNISRWNSYFHQIDEILKLKQNNILEIGIGNSFLKNYFDNNFKNISFKTLDINPDLNPDYVSSVDNINLDDNLFDIVCAFEVLEHLPFEKLEQCLKSLHRVSKKYCIISVPHWGRNFGFKIILPYFHEIKVHFKLPFLAKKHIFNGEHYWEIGKKGFKLNKIKKIIDNYFDIKKDFVSFENPYHHFFILEKR
ncbi:MAG: methyltransferase domain-containing protein [Patescibacteria group bacterium]|nr:methyltransferase domain-containing protein [Patescibacteria group bacterium]MDD4304271.1 methyltransferase domain-containing protein [Patescibacteria group bacterium]MDD4695325.1 methyltransferase domain-containing protein [Patescibacteria group bacterium]